MRGLLTWLFNWKWTWGLRMGLALSRVEWRRVPLRVCVWYTIHICVGFRGCFCGLYGLVWNGFAFGSAGLKNAKPECGSFSEKSIITIAAT